MSNTLVKTWSNHELVINFYDDGSALMAYKESGMLASFSNIAPNMSNMYKYRPDFMELGYSDQAYVIHEMVLNVDVETFNRYTGYNLVETKGE